jgi:aminopeptidase YwaD
MIFLPKMADLTTPRLLDYTGARGAGAAYAYEALNFADGARDARQICDELSVEFGPVSLDLVVEYLEALRKIGILENSNGLATAK